MQYFQGAWTHTVVTNLNLFQVIFEGHQTVVCRITKLCIFQTRQDVLDANYAIEIRGLHFIICIFRSSCMCLIVLGNTSDLEPLSLVFSNCNDTRTPDITNQEFVFCGIVASCKSRSKSQHIVISLDPYGNSKVFQIFIHTIKCIVVRVIYTVVEISCLAIKTVSTSKS